MTSTSRKDRFITKLVSFLNRAVYQDVEVYWAAPVPPDAPQLTVSNHFGGFADALVLLNVMPRRPGIVARDVIWKIPLAGWLMNWIGGIPVHKPEDSGSSSRNDEMFSSCYDALRGDGHILIFPEGVTRNEPSIAPVKTGAARIALGARTSGVTGIQLLPVGIHYEDKAALRSRVSVNVGLPLDLDAAARDLESGGHSATANDRDAVRALTEEINVGLRRVAPDYENWAEAQALSKSAEITLRSQLNDPIGEVPFGLRDRLANTLADRPEASRSRIIHAVQEYQQDLDGAGYCDAELNSALKTGRFMRSLVSQIVVAVLLFPFALVGAAINFIPFLVVKAVGLLRVAPSVAASIKPVTAIAMFGIAWGAVIWQAISKYGWVAGVAAFILLPVYLTAAIAFLERVVRLWGAFRRWRASSGTGGIADDVRTRRATVVEAVLAA